MFRNIKNKIIYFPRILYPFVYLYACIVFGRQYKVSFPSKKIIFDSTHFVFILTDKKTGDRYLLKFRNKFSDFYFQHKNKVSVVSPKKYIEFLGMAERNSSVKEVMPERRIYKDKVLWKFIEDATEVDSENLNLDRDQVNLIMNRVRNVVAELQKEGLNYGRVKKKHVLITKEGEDLKPILIDWDNIRLC